MRILDAVSNLMSMPDAIQSNLENLLIMIWKVKWVLKLIVVVVDNGQLINNDDIGSSSKLTI